MPTLHWIGKEKVVNHHQQVPYRVLEHQYGFTATDGEKKGTETGSGNKIIHGDNLEALKALLPEYEGRINCIYIDPPYNTGNEGWVYNDNVNDPKIKKWLHQVVGKDGEDLSRHDKWLCMMYPRLMLLHKLLAENGTIFISIDDNEQANLKLICDEIFGSSNLLSSFVWRRRASSQLSQNNVSVDHEYVVAYSKSNATKFNGVKKDYKNYSNPDNDPKGDWTLGDLTVGMTKDQRPNQFFDLIDPVTLKVYSPSPKRVWTFAPETMKEKVKENRVVFPKSLSGRPMLKRYLRELKTDINPLSTWISNDAYGIGLNSEGTKIIQAYFEEKVFDYPKPTSLIEILVDQTTTENDIVLDSFAGSGTTAHAILNLNKRDGGKRNFILIEMEEYAESITGERIKRVAKGHGSQDGTGGSFDYYTLGEPMFDEDKMLNENIAVEKIRQYVYYTETQQPLTEGKPYQKKDNNYLLDKYNATGYYFFYEKDEMTTLNNDFLATIKTKADQYVIYADNCLLSKEFMLKKNIVFKKIPRDITRF